MEKKKISINDNILKKKKTISKQAIDSGIK